MSIIMVIIFILISAYPLSMLFGVLTISGGFIKDVKGYIYFLVYWASVVILATPFIAIEYARA